MTRILRIRKRRICRREIKRIADFERQIPNPKPETQNTNLGFCRRELFCSSPTPKPQTPIPNPSPGAKTSGSIGRSTGGEVCSKSFRACALRIPCRAIVV
jgi:hypothetical protein